MSYRRKGMLTQSLEWAKHLRPYGRRRFWGRERMAERKLINGPKQELAEGSFEEDDWEFEDDEELLDCLYEQSTN